MRPWMKRIAFKGIQYVSGSEIVNSGTRRQPSGAALLSEGELSKLDRGRCCGLIFRVTPSRFPTRGRGKFVAGRVGRCGSRWLSSSLIMTVEHDFLMGISHNAVPVYGRACRSEAVDVVPRFI